MAFGRRLTAVDCGAAVAVVLNLLAVIPPIKDDYLEFGLVALIALTGFAYAVCAVLASRLRAPGMTVPLLLVGSVGMSLTGLWLLTDAWNPGWPVLWAGAVLPVPVPVLLALSYPTGRIRGTGSWIVAGLAVIAFLVVAVARLVFYDPGTWGYVDATPNVFAIADSAADAPNLANLYLRCELAVALASLLAVGVRWWRGSAPWRAVNLLMALSFGLLAVSWVWFDLSVLLGGFADNAPAQYLTYVSTGALPVLYVVSLARQRAARARVADLLLADRARIGHQRWEELVGDALDDPSAELIWVDGGSWVTASGQPTDDPRTRTGVATVPIGPPDDLLAVIVHDPAVTARSELLGSVAEAIWLGVSNERLTDRLSRTLDEVRESRVRIVGASDAARREIERDLHDGVQQYLVSAAIQLRLAGEQVGHVDDETLHVALATVDTLLRQASVELRRTVRGITPTALTHSGVADALEELAIRCGVPTHLTITGDQEPDVMTQTSIYYVVAECLTNVAKHARANRATVTVELSERPMVRVEDDGVGGADPAGSGLRGIADRATATGGSLRVDSPPGCGTRIEARL